MSTLPKTTSLSPEDLNSLRDKIRDLPKVELHRHLEGSLRFSTLCYYYCTESLKLSHEVAEAAVAGLQSGIEVDEGKHNGLPSREVLINAVTKHFCVAEPTQSLTSFLKKFEHTQALFKTYDVVERMAYECVEDSYNDGTKVLEIRYSPLYVRGGNPELKLDGIHDAVLRGIAQAKEKYSIAVGLIGILDRHEPKERVQEALDFIISRKDSFLGIDLANDEASHNCLDFLPYFQQARDAGLNITVHSGEVPVNEAPEWVLNSITKLGAQRIGHGFNVMRDPNVVNEIIQKYPSVTFEVCPSSNYLCQGVESVEQHPLKAMMEAGLKCTINTDDPGMFLINMKTECEVAITVLNLTLDEVKQLMDNAYLASFIPDSEKSKYYPVPQ